MSKKCQKVIKVVKKIVATNNSQNKVEEEEEEEEDNWYSLDQVPTTSHLVKM
jgi:hypothetical protein